MCRGHRRVLLLYRLNAPPVDFPRVPAAAHKIIGHLRKTTNADQPHEDSMKPITNAVPRLCDPLMGIWSEMNAASGLIRSGDLDAAAERICGVAELALGIESRAVRIIGLLAKAKSASGPDVGRISQAIADETGVPVEAVFSVIADGEQS